MARRCASVAAFLQQAEENLALLNAKSGRCEGALHPKNLSEHLRLASAGLSPSPGPSPAHTENSVEILGQSVRRTPGNDKDDIVAHAASRTELTPRQTHGLSPRCLSAQMSSPRVHSQLDDPIRKLELREADAKEQMDIQAKMMLGVDRKIKAFDNRLRAVEAGVAVAVDVSSGGGGASSSKSLESRLCVLESAMKSAPTLSPRSIVACDTALDGSSAQSIMEIQRRLAALAEGARRDREASRKYAKGLVDELSSSLRQQLEDMERQTLEREVRLSEEAQHRAQDVGREIAGSLLRGPIAELVEIRVRDFEERFAAASQSQLLEFREEFLNTLCKQESVMHNLNFFARESAKAAVLDEIAVRTFQPGDADDGFPAAGARNDLWRQTAERVAELEARDQGEAETYWTVVQSLEVRVAGLEEELGQSQQSPVSEAVVTRLTSLETEMASVRQRLSKGVEHGRVGIVQDPAAASVKRERKSVTLSSTRQAPRQTTHSAAEVPEAAQAALVTLGPEESGLMTSLPDTSGRSPSFGLWREKQSVQDGRAEPIVTTSQDMELPKGKPTFAATLHDVVKLTSHPNLSKAPLSPLVLSTPQSEETHVGDGGRDDGAHFSRRSSSMSADSADIDDILAKHGVISPASSSRSILEGRAKPSGTVPALPPSPPSPPRLADAHRPGQDVVRQQLDYTRTAARRRELGLDEESADSVDHIYSGASSEHEFADDDDLPLEI